MDISRYQTMPLITGNRLNKNNTTPVGTGSNFIYHHSKIVL